MTRFLSLICFLSITLSFAQKEEAKWDVNAPGDEF